ncbi:MAG: transposase [Planctomycetota bacterium]|jgi:REP element-mobilizing transposase RayT
MPRKPRADYPDAWHHVMNRGIARRSVFESRSDFRYFMSQMARAARRKEIEVYAFCLMTTHFHLLLKSVDGQLAIAMQRIENSYVRRFNRERRRDGSLFRGRYTSKLVESEAYRRILFRYIHFNPVKGGVVDRPGDYKFSSARMLGLDRRPKWLSDYWLQAEERETAEASQRRLKKAECELVERRLESEELGPDPLDHLLNANSHAILSWLRSRAIKADRSRPGSPVVGERIIASTFYDLRAGDEVWEIRLRGRVWDAAMIAEIYMLRDLAGLRFAEVAKRMDITQSTARRRYADHVQAMEQESYAARISSLLRSILSRGFGETEPGSAPPGGEREPGSVLSLDLGLLNFER